MKIIPQGLTQSVGRQILQAKKQSPHIFFVGGVIGVGVSTFMACKATLKLEETVDEIKHDLKAVKEMSERKSANDPSYSERDYYKDLGYVYGKSVNSIAHLYGPAVLVGGVSIAALTGSHIQLTRRNAALSATLAAVTKAYDDYRERIREELGEERELAIYQDVEEEKVERDGKKTTESVRKSGGFSIYARLFEESNVNWKNDAELNRIFIQVQENYWNYKLQSRGHVFLNEVYDSLGLERSKPGQVVGWTLNGDGDGHIDFGLSDPSSEPFVQGHEKNVWLDFNVDGVIYEKF